MAKHIKIGDVIEVPTKKGLAYAQYSHKNKMFGVLLRIIPGIFTERPSDLEAHIRQRQSYFTFFPLQAAINRKIFQVITNVAVPDFALPFPLFRAGVCDSITKRVKVWWLWDGENEWRVGEITQAQRELSMRSIWNDTLLIERIEDGWTPASDPE